MNQNSVRQIRKVIAGGILLVGGLLYLLLPVIANRWQQLPFPGFFIDPNLVVNDISLDSWPSGQRMVNYPARLIDVDGQEVRSSTDLQAVLAGRQEGEEVALTFIQPVNSRVAPNRAEPSSALTLPLSEISREALWRFFWLPYLVGLITLAIGGWTFRMRPDAEAAQLFVVFAVLTAWGVGGLFDTLTTHTFIHFWVTGVIFSGPLCFFLAIIFPHEILFLRRWPNLRFILLIPLFALLIWALWWLFLPSDPWAYAIPWRYAFLLDSIALITILILMFYRGFRSNSPLVRQQGRIILAGSVIAFIPVLIFFLRLIFFPELLSGTIFVDPTFYLPPIILFPLSVGYTIIRYRLLDINVVLRQAITYGLLTGTLVILFAAVVAGLGSLLGPLFAADNPFFLAIFVILLTLIFTPLRDRLQAAVDRYFFRKPVAYDALLRRYNRTLTSAVNVDQLAGALLNHVTLALPDSRPVLYLPDSQMTSYSAYQGKATAGTANVRPLDAASPLVRFFSRDPGAIYLGEERSWPPELRPYHEDIKALNGNVIVPMISQQKLLGWLSLEETAERPSLNPAELSYLNALANQSLIALERVNVIRRYEARVAELVLLSQFSQALNFTISFDDLLELIATNCLRLLETEDFFVSLGDAETGQIYRAFHLEQNERLPEKEGPQQIVTDERLLEVINTGQMTVDGADGLAWMAAPLNAGAEALGALHTYRRQQGQRFLERQQQLFSVFSDRVAIALDRWQANEKLKLRATQLQTLNEVIGSLTATLDVGELLELILDKAMTLLETEAGTFMLVSGNVGELEFRVARGPTSGNLVGQRLPIGTGLAGTVAQTGRPIIVNDAQHDTRWFSGIDASSEFVTQTILTVPLLRYREVLGVLQVINKYSGGPFNEDDQTLLTAFAGQAVVALENARLLHQTDEELQERVSELSLLQQLDRDLNTTLELASVVNLTLDWVLRTCSATAGGLVLILDGEARLVASRGYDESFGPDSVDSETLKAGLIGMVLKNGKPHLAKDVHQHPNYIAAAFDTLSQMTIPITHKQDVIGAIAIESSRPAAFDPRNVEVAIRVTDHAAVAIANAILYEQVIEANDAKSEFVSMVSHELKTPMTSVQGYTDLILNGVTGEINQKQREFLQTITANIRRMGTLIQDLTDISRIETNHLSISPAPMSFAKVISDTLQITQTLSQEKAIEVHVDLPVNLPPVVGDQERLVQVMTNLLSNACKYSPPGSEVFLTVKTELQVGQNGDNGSPPQPFVICSVKDSGYGISESDQAKMFTKFFRAGDPNIRQSPGTGLGLSITKGIVELHGGAIWFESKLGEGTTFHFTIPQVNGQG